MVLSLLFKKLQVEMLKIHGLAPSLGSNRIHSGHGIHAVRYPVFGSCFWHKGFNPNRVAKRADGNRESKTADHSWPRDFRWSLVVQFDGLERGMVGRHPVHLTFGQYVGLNQRPAIKDLVALIRNEDTYETFRAELLRQPVEHEDDASFLAGLKERMDSIEKMRNAVAHNRRPSKKTINDYLNAFPLVNQALDDYLGALAADARDAAGPEVGPSA